MRTDYRYDDFQQTYFVIDSYEELMESTANVDFTPIYERIKDLPDIPESVREAVDFHFAKRIDQVLEIALEDWPPADLKKRLQTAEMGVA